MVSRLQIQGDDESVLLRVTHSNIKSFSSDVRFSLQDESNTKICDLKDNLRPLGFNSSQDSYRFHIIDLDPSSITSGGWLECPSLVEKYSISEEFGKLDGTFRKYKGKFVSQNPSVIENKLPENYMEDVKVGDRCKVELGEKRGVVEYVDVVESMAPGFWIGVQYDEPLGKHDCIVRGRRYFECPPFLGARVRPDRVKVGDYPERDLFEDEEI